MGTLLKMMNPVETDYVDRRFKGSKEQYFALISKSSTLYIGNLAFVTSEEQVWELFSLVGRVKRIHMGLDKLKRTPCGFCFVIYYRRADALAAIKYLNGTLLDGRLIRVDIDYGFEEERKWGRGRSGGQVRDEYRVDYDEGRGGYGVQMFQMFHGVTSAAAMPHMDTPMFFGANQRAQPPAPPPGSSAAGGGAAAPDADAAAAAAADDGGGDEAGANGQQEADTADPAAAAALMGDEEEAHGTPAPKRRRLPTAEEAEEDAAADQPDEEPAGDGEQQQDAAMTDAAGAADAGDLVDYE